MFSYNKISLTDVIHIGIWIKVNMSLLRTIQTETAGRADIKQ